MTTTPPTTEQLLGGGGRAVKFEAPGDAVEGIIVDKTTSQVTDYKTGEKMFYPRSGDPIWQIIASLETTLREDPDDDGARRVFFKSGLYKALKDTIKAMKLKDIEIGGWIRVVFTHFGIPEGGGNAPKVYIVEYRPPTPVGQQAPQQNHYIQHPTAVNPPQPSFAQPQYQQSPYATTTAAPQQPQYQPQPVAPQFSAPVPNPQAGGLPGAPVAQTPPEAANQAGGYTPEQLAQIQAVRNASLNPADVFTWYHG